MGKVIVNSFTVSLDGYGAGPNQSLDNPLGVSGTELHHWAFATRTFRAMHGGEGGSTGVDDELARRGMENVGAWILGRNMFGPVRGPWPDEHWRGWWGEEPPYRCGGGVATIQQYVRARLIDELHVAFGPVLLGSGEALLAGIDLRELGYAVTEHIATPAATHVVLTRTS
jgi:dihydrofolate reductase